MKTMKELLSMPAAELKELEDATYKYWVDIRAALTVVEKIEKEGDSLHE